LEVRIYLISEKIKKDNTSIFWKTKVRESEEIELTSHKEARPQEEEEEAERKEPPDNKLPDKKSPSKQQQLEHVLYVNLNHPIPANINI
jgi:hypothetical protein